MHQVVGQEPRFGNKWQSSQTASSVIQYYQLDDWVFVKIKTLKNQNRLPKAVQEVGVKYLVPDRKTIQSFQYKHLC